MEFIYYASDCVLLLEITIDTRDIFYSITDFSFFQLISRFPVGNTWENGKNTFVWTTPTRLGFLRCGFFWGNCVWDPKNISIPFAVSMSHKIHMFTLSNRGTSFSSRNFIEMSFLAISWIFILIVAFETIFIANSLTGDHVCSRIEKLVSNIIIIMYNCKINLIYIL